MKLKYPFFIIVLSIVTMYSSSFAQNSTQVGLPDGAIARLGKGGINVMRFSPDGTRLAVGTSIGVWLYDVENGKERLLSAGNVTHINSLAFSTDGKIIAASGDFNSEIQLWDTESGNHLLSINLSDRFLEVSAMVFTKNNQKLTCLVSNRYIAEWDVNTGQELSTKDVPFSERVFAFSQNGLTFVSGDTENGNIRLWITDTADEGDIFKKKPQSVLAESLSNLLKEDPEENLDGVHAIALSPDNRTVASANHDNTVRLWDTATKSERTILKGHTENINVLVFSHDSTMLGSGSSDNRILLWNVNTGKLQATLKGHKNSVSALAFSPSETGLLASGSSDGTIRLWNTETGQEQSIFAKGHISGIKAAAFTADNTMLTSAAYNGTVQIWDVMTREKIPSLSLTHFDRVEALVISQDATLFAVHGADTIVQGRGDNFGILLMQNKETHIHILPIGDKLISLSQKANSLAFSPDKRILAAGTDRHGIRVWDINAGVELFRFNTQGPFERNLTFSPDGKLLATNGVHVNTQVWDITTQQEITPTNIMSGPGLAFSPDGTILALGSPEGVFMWNVNQATLQERATLPVTKRGFGVMIKFSPDGKTLLDTKMSSKQGKIQFIVELWDVETGSNLGTLSGHTGQIQTLQFSHDGKLLATGGLDGTLLLWDWEKINARLNADRIRKKLSNNLLYPEEPKEYAEKVEEAEAVINWSGLTHFYKMVYTILL